MNADEIKVSVIVPVYNVQKYVEQCIKSLLEQTLRDIEIICIDDGSTDSSSEIIEEKALADERIRIIKVLISYQIKSLEGLFRDCKCIESINFKKFLSLSRNYEN